MLNNTDVSCEGPVADPAAPTVGDAPPLCPSEVPDVGPERINQIIRRILEVRGYAARVEAWATQERQRAQRQENWLTHRYAALLEAWLRGELSRRREKGRCVHLPAGTLALRRAPDRLDVTDEQQLVAWCESHLPAAFRCRIEATGAAAITLRAAATPLGVDRLTTSVSLDEVKQHVREAGVLPSGVERRDGADRLFIR